MAYDIGWIIPRLRNPGCLWTCASSITVAVVGLFSKFIVVFLNKTTVYNREALVRAVRRPPDVPLLTVSNHHSCFDDPGLWGVLDASTLVRGGRMRWSLAAHDICFTNALHSAFFALGKCVPVVRGAGVHQPAMDFCVERLVRGEWVHIFPEGRVNVDKERIRFKWGVGRLVADSAAAGRAPLVLPVWHEGMDRVLPNAEPYRLRAHNAVHLTVGEPIRLRPLLDALRGAGASEEDTRRAITERIQRELMLLRERAHLLLLRDDAPAPSPAPASASASADDSEKENCGGPERHDDEKDVDTRSQTSAGDAPPDNDKGLERALLARNAGRLRRSESLSKGERLSKLEKGEWNVVRRREAGAWRSTKLKRKNGMPERGIKRRHTVGGTKDFDKDGWAARHTRTSSPDLSPAAWRAAPACAPAWRAPLESHV